MRVADSTMDALMMILYSGLNGLDFRPENNKIRWKTENE
jgi:hypothetical protein